MRIGTFKEAFDSINSRFRKNVLGNRVFMILLWCQLGLMLGSVGCYLVIEISTAYLIRQTEANSLTGGAHDFDILYTVTKLGWFFVIGLPMAGLILGICGILPGTHRSREAKNIPQ